MLKEFPWVEFYRQTLKIKIKFPFLRVGQIYFNTLLDINNDLANIIRGTENDPFYSDEKIPLFIQSITDYYKKEH